VASGKAKWTELLTVRPQDKVSGSGVIGTELSDGAQLALRDVANLMIVLSDNSATNIILERFTADTRPTPTWKDRLEDDAFHAQGARRRHAAQGKPRDGRPRVSCRRIRSTAWEFRRRANGDDFRKAGEGRDRQPGGFQGDPGDSETLSGLAGVRRKLSGVTIANKTGALDALRSEVALVYSKGGRIAMAITTDGMPKTDWSPDNAGLLLILGDYPNAGRGPREEVTGGI